MEHMLFMCKALGLILNIPARKTKTRVSQMVCVCVGGGCFSFSFSLVSFIKKIKSYIKINKSKSKQRLLVRLWREPRASEQQMLMGTNQNVLPSTVAIALEIIGLVENNLCTIYKHICLFTLKKKNLFEGTNSTPTPAVNVIPFSLYSETLLQWCQHSLPPDSLSSSHLIVLTLLGDMEKETC